MAISCTLLAPEKIIIFSSDTCVICKDTNSSRNYLNSAHHSETLFVPYNSRVTLEHEDNDCDDDDDDD